MKRLTTPTPNSADDVLDACMRILGAQIVLLEKKKVLEPSEIDTVVRVARAATEVMQLQLDPLGPAGRKKLSKLSNEELQAAIARAGGSETKEGLQ